MTFSEYLKSKTSFLIIFFSINAFALFVNTFGIEGNVSPENKLGGLNEELKTINLFTCIEKKSSSASSSFWPFVKFYESQTLYNPYYDTGQGTWKTTKFSSFNGIFYRYDISEFMAYGFIVFLFLYFRWSIKWTEKKSI